MKSPLAIVPVPLLVSLLLAAGTPAGVCATSLPKPSFEKHFQATTLRMDLVRAGHAEEQSWAIEHVGVEGAWAGSRRLLIDTMDLGELLFEVRDAESGQLLFSRGFSSLFSEWLSTSEARGPNARAGHETLRFPLPRHPVRIEVKERGENGRFEAAASFSLDPSRYDLAPWPKLPIPLEVIDLLHNGAMESRVDLLVVADGYPDSQAEKFRRDLNRLLASLASEEPWASALDLFNLRAIRARSASAGGPAEPRKGLFEPEALTSFDTFGSPRYLCPKNFRVLEDLAGSVPHDVLIVLVNTARYGGGGVFRQFTVSTADSEFDAYLFLHEFGHGFAGLGDEYYTSAVAYETPTPSVEPWEPNLTLQTERSALKWGQLVQDSTPLPTPDDARFDGVVGAFEGGGYRAHGVFRPARRCKMKDKGAVGYCAVCTRAIRRMIAFTAGLDELPGQRRTREAP